MVFPNPISSVKIFVSQFVSSREREIERERKEREKEKKREKEKERKREREKKRKKREREPARIPFLSSDQQCIIQFKPSN